MPTRPNTCIIGAGISGLTAGKALSDRGVPYTCFEASDDVGGNWYFGNPNGRSSAYRSLHIDTSRDSVSFRDMPMSETEYPDYPHHAQILEYLDELRRRVRAARADPLRAPPSSAPSAIPAAAGRSPPRTARAMSSTFLVVGNGHHWDPAHRGVPRRASTGETIHSHHYVDPTEPLDMHRQARAGRRHRQQRGRHRLRALAQGRRRARLPLDPQRRLGDAEVRVRPAGRTSSSRRTRTSR